MLELIKKTIMNIYSKANRETIIDVFNINYNYLVKMISELESLDNQQIDVNIILKYNNISITLNLVESLIVINSLATKKIALRGGAWSSIGKSVEKPFLNKLCDLSGVPEKNRISNIFIKDKNKVVDREIDYKLIDRNNNIINIEMKLMGRGKPESADVVIARNSKIFIADTLSEQNKAQLSQLSIYYLELKNNNHIIEDFRKILDLCNIEYYKNGE